MRADAMHVDADVRVAADGPLAGVDAHPDTHGFATFPRLSGQGTLRCDRGGDGTRRRLEDREHRITLRAEDLALAGGHRLAEELVVPVQHRRPAVTEALRRLRRPLDVGEQEGDGPAR